MPLAKPWSNKSPEMRAALEHMFPDRATRIAEGKCPECATEITEEEFRDDISRREYTLSGMCQNCQDQIFGLSEG